VVYVYACTGERCDVAIDKGFTSDNATNDVINTDDSVEPNGIFYYPVNVRQN